MKIETLPDGTQFLVEGQFVWRYDEAKHCRGMLDEAGIDYRSHTTGKALSFGGIQNIQMNGEEIWRQQPPEFPMQFGITSPEQAKRAQRWAEHLKSSQCINSIPMGPGGVLQIRDQLSDWDFVLRYEGDRCFTGRRGKFEAKLYGTPDDDKRNLIAPWAAFVTMDGHGTILATSDEPDLGLLIDMVRATIIKAEVNGTR